METYYNMLVMVLAGLSMLGGARYFWVLARVQRQARAVGESSLGWPTVQGKIVQSEIAKDNDSGWYLPVVAYDYAVAGESYRGSQIAFKIIYPGTRKKAQRIADRYKLGTLVDVHYDPADPRRSVLEHGRRTSWFGPWLAIPMAIICVVIAIALVLGAIGVFLDRHAGVGH